MKETGKVFLVGAGPGHPGMITVRGLELVKNADVIVYDQLGTANFIKEAKESCELIDVGKRAGKHTLPQEEINELLVKKATEGLSVVRLKGGDPMVFGRGGEELQRLHKSMIPFEIVPGITSAISAPEFAGIPVTHRDFTSTVAFITGHESAKQDSSIDWNALSKIGTLVFLMGVKNLPTIVKKLIEAGVPANRPIALIQNGSLPIQKTVTGTLETIVKVVEEGGIKAPAITIVGEVVSLRPVMKWFEDKPLFGKTIVVTRSRHQASALSKELEALGANVIECPAIKIKQIKNSDEFSEFFKNFETFSHLIFTSINGVEGFITSLLDRKMDLRSLSGKKIVCIGPATAEGFKSRGIIPDFIPETFIAESIIPFFENKQKLNIAILRAEKARKVLPQELEKLGHVVQVINVYKTELEAAATESFIAASENGKIDLVTFTSSSTVDGYIKILEANNIEKKQFKGIAIGPITAKTAEDYGIDLAATADEYTVPGLVAKILEYFRNKND